MANYKRKKDRYRINSKTGCWKWVLFIGKDGYGQEWFKGQTRRAHRNYYERKFGPVPKGLYVCHKCDNPPCVNPDHMFIGTQKENQSDMVKKDRSAKGENVNSNKLTKNQVRKVKSLRGKMSYREIAKMFNLRSKSTIGFIFHGKTWKHIH